MGEASFDTLGQLELRGKKESGGEKGRRVGELGLGHEHTPEQLALGEPAASLSQMCQSCGKNSEPGSVYLQVRPV